MGAGTGLKRRYEERILPVVIDKACASPGFAAPRAGTVAGTHGTVLEVGFGSGLNLAHYPVAVERLWAVEPAGRAVELAAARIARAPFPVEVIGLDGQHLPVGSASVDCVVSTFTLCTIPDAQAALSEIRRVLRPGGTFHVLEHGLADDPRVQRWQQRLTPVQRAVAGGCHLNRHIPTLVEQEGFAWTTTERWYAGRPRSLTLLTRGVATVA